VRLLRCQGWGRSSIAWRGVLVLTALAILLAPALDFLGPDPDGPGDPDGSAGDSMGLRPESGTVRFLDHLRRVSTTPVAFAPHHGFTLRLPEILRLFPKRPRQDFSAWQSRVILQIYQPRGSPMAAESSTGAEPA